MHALVLVADVEEVRAKLTSKGQLTVPKDVRERLSLKSGDRVVFEFEGDSVRLRVERRRSLEELRGSLPATREYLGKAGGFLLD
jgi:antitoxin PrlF